MCNVEFGSVQFGSEHGPNGPPYYTHMQCLLTRAHYGLATLYDAVLVLIEPLQRGLSLQEATHSAPAHAQLELVEHYVT